MRRFLDASILVEACLAQSPKFTAADALVKGSDTVTSAHALAEAYARCPVTLDSKSAPGTRRRWWAIWLLRSRSVL